MGRPATSRSTSSPDSADLHRGYEGCRGQEPAGARALGTLQNDDRDVSRLAAARPARVSGAHADVREVAIAKHGLNYFNGSWSRRLRVRTVADETCLLVPKPIKTCSTVLLYLAASGAADADHHSSERFGSSG
jgi:hypothetical protein